MLKGSGHWSYDPEEHLWYFALDERADPPYRKQIRVEAILDLDGEGRLAGLEIIDRKPDGAPIEPPTGVRK